MYSYSKTNINVTTDKILVRISSAFHYVLQTSSMSNLVHHCLTSRQQLKIVFQQTLFPPFLKAVFPYSEALFCQRDHSRCWVVLFDAVWPSE